MAYTDINNTIKNRNGTFSSLSADINAVNNSLNNILSIRPGTYPGNPLFGCNIGKFVFEQINPLTVQLMEEEIRYSISLFEKRVKIKKIEIKEDLDYNRVIINILFNITGTLDKTDKFKRG